MKNLNDKTLSCVAIRTDGQDGIISEVGVVNMNGEEMHTINHTPSGFGVRFLTVEWLMTAVQDSEALVFFDQRTKRELTMLCLQFGVSIEKEWVDGAQLVRETLPHLIQHDDDGLAEIADRLRLEFVESDARWDAFALAVAVNQALTPDMDVAA
ncbi:hypothetical protein [Yoonia sp. SDW83-1]|uniref:hypothetical protein n=1 Tax=Yoonia sp. SDW83-1 TaxID=3366945 RepID=UPI00398C8037